MSRQSGTPLGPYRADNNARRGMAAGVLLAAAFASAACTASQPRGEATADADVVGYLPEQNITLWTMPLDQYMVSRAQSQRESYATVLLTQNCLDEEGYINKVPTMSIVDDDSGIRDVFTPESVAINGYHSAGVLRDTDPAWTAYTQRPMSEKEAEAVDACVRKVLDDGFVRYDNQVLNFASGLAQAAVSGSFQDPDVKSAGARWHECMAPRGIEDLPADPSEMPSPSISLRFGLSATPEAGQAVSVSPEEIELAVFDAECRQSSGYEEARYGAEWSRQVTLLAENLDALESLKAQIAGIDRSLSDIVSANAPAA